MKRFLIILLAFLLLLSFAACGGLSENDETSADSNNTTETPESTEELDSSEIIKVPDGESTQASGSGTEADSETTGEPHKYVVEGLKAITYEKDGISVSVSFAKSTYVTDEPIEMEVSISNQSTEELEFYIHCTDTAIINESVFGQASNTYLCAFVTDISADESDYIVLTVGETVVLRCTVSVDNEEYAPYINDMHSFLEIRLWVRDKIFPLIDLNIPFTLTLIEEDSNGTTETPESTDRSESAVLDPSITFLAGLPEDPWYFSWKPCSLAAVRQLAEWRLLEPLTADDRQKVLKTPVVHETTEGDLGFRYDFFSELWCHRSLMQVRITVTNHGKDTLILREAPYYSTALYDGEGNVCNTPREGFISPEDEASYHASTLQDWTEPISLSPEASCTFERVFLVSADPQEPVTEMRTRLKVYESDTATESNTVTVAVPLSTDLLAEIPIEAETLPTVADTETPWYIEGWETGAAYVAPTVSAEKRELAVQLPTVYENTLRGLSVRAEFFQAYYLLGEPIQVKLTLTNETEETLRFLANGQSVASFVQKNAENDPLIQSWQYLPEANDREEYTYGYHADPSVRCITLPAGKSVTLEYMYTADPSFFAPAELYYFRIHVKTYNEASQPDGGYTFAFPLKVTEVALTEE